MKKNKISSMIIGLGNIGLNYDINLNKSFLTHAKSIIKSSNFSLLCGVDKDYRQLNKFKKKYNLPAYLDHDLALKIHKPELIVISTLENNHLNILKKICSYNSVRYILLEKPGGEDYHQLQRAFQYCEKKNIILFVNYFRNFLPYFVFLAKKLKKIKIKVFVIYTRGVRNNCSHVIALLLMINDMFDVSKVKVKSYVKKKLSEDFNFRLNFKNIEAYFFSPKISKLSITKVDFYSDLFCLYSDNSFMEFDYFHKKNSKLIKDSFEYNFVKKNINLYIDKTQIAFYDNFSNILKKYKKFKNISLNCSKILDKIYRKV